MKKLDKNVYCGLLKHFQKNMLPAVCVGWG